MGSQEKSQGLSDFPGRMYPQASKDQGWSQRTRIVRIPASSRACANLHVCLGGRGESLTFESRHLLELKLTQCVTALPPKEANHTHVELGMPRAGD